MVRPTSRILRDQASFLVSYQLRQPHRDRPQDHVQGQGGLGTEHIIASKVKIFTEGEKIKKVEDRWNDELPEGAFKNVSVLSLRSWLYYGQSWVYWGWHFCWETWWWRVRGSCYHPPVVVVDIICRLPRLRLIGVSYRL